MNDPHALPPIALNQHDWGEIRRVLTQCVPEYAVWAFGSRVTGDARPYSDLDLVIKTGNRLSLKRMATIKEAFDESDLTIKVDVVDWAATGSAFQEIIQQQYVVIQQAAGSTEKYSFNPDIPKQKES